MTMIGRQGTWCDCGLVVCKVLHASLMLGGPCNDNDSQTGHGVRLWACSMQSASCITNAGRTMRRNTGHGVQPVGKYIQRV